MKRIISLWGIFNIFLIILAAGVAAQEVYVEPSSSSVFINDTFEINITISGTDISGVDFNLSFNNAILSATNVVLGSFFTECAGCSVLTIPSPGNSINNGAGTIRLAIALNSGYVSGTGAAATITFKAKSPGTSQLDLRDVTLTDKNINSIPGIEIYNGSATVSTNESICDVGVSSISFNPINPVQEDNVTLTAVIKNLGDVSLDLVTNVSLYIDDIYKNSRILNLKNINEKEINFSWIAEKGTHKITLLLDPNKEIAEVNELNNEISENINVFECIANSTCEYNQFCNSSTHLCQPLNCQTNYEPFNHQCYPVCNPGHDGVYIHDYNDLMTDYRCFLGIKRNCDNYYQNWGLMKQEYKCFAKN